MDEARALDRQHVRMLHVQHASTLGQPMNETIVGASKARRSVPCKRCKRTIVFVEVETEIEGEIISVAVDPEVIRTVAYPSGTVRQVSRRVHAEMCTSYQIENDRKAAREAREAFIKGKGRKR